MDEDIEFGQELFRGIIQGGYDVARVVTVVDPNLTDEEKEARLEAAETVQQALRGVVDIAAVLLQARRTAERNVWE